MHPLIINAKIEACNLCSLGDQRGLGYGNIKSKILFLAQNPGVNEGRETRDIIPFGLNSKGENSGVYLKKLLDEVKLTEKDFYITNIIKCATPYNRRPSYDEIWNCKEHLNRELDIQQPKIIFLLGKVAQEAWRKQDKSQYVHEMWHPGFILRDPTKFQQWREGFMKFFFLHCHILERSNNEN